MKTKSQDVCEITCVDSEKVQRLKAQIDDQETSNIAKIYKALADDTRVKIAFALSLEEELCVCDVAHIVGATTATASHHLRLLNNLGLAKYRKEGKLVYYSLDDDHVKQLIQIAFAHQKELSYRGQ
ncbi:metalloregulator ArsR/SmtB family transcription factor [Metabacillus idriensis]|uniref:ArsR/SmtB family transcription factor n=1 Tax=Metabacillus idriensis TaxID=324768 RepID=UPI0008A9B71D|nr:metalloregulator ArsR/SmtB family transcription factor [Metabacillus idriensis]MCM3597979.1 metalloregulator ArsR/SmtB family transcription factor [Metabacillus idriensis]OHR73653.1 transcriptional regulator [Bacillus sp. HMSC76G11]